MNDPFDRREDALASSSTSSPSPRCDLLRAGEVINPGTTKHPGLKLTSNLPGPIGQPRINHHNLYSKPAADRH